MFGRSGFRGYDMGLNNYHTILGVPSYDYSIIYPRTLFLVLRPLYYSTIIDPLKDPFKDPFKGEVCSFRAFGDSGFRLGD